MGKERVPTDPSMNGDCPYGKPVPEGVSALPTAPCHFDMSVNGQGGQPAPAGSGKGLQQGQLPRGAGGLGEQQLGCFRESGLSTAHR